MPEKKIIKEGKRQRKGRKKLMPERKSIGGRKKTEKTDHRWKENKKKDKRNSEKHEKSKKRA